MQPGCRTSLLLYELKRRELVYTAAGLHKQEEVQPGCTKGSAARLYKGKCSQAVQREVRPGCTKGSAARLFKSYKRKYSLAALLLVQPGCSVVYLPPLIPEGKEFSNSLLKGSTTAWPHFLLYSQAVVSFSSL